MTLADIRDWLKTQVECPHWYIGKVDGSKEYCIGLYNAPGPAPNIAIGGIENTSYATKSISILIHWGKNANLAEIKAKEVYDCMFGKGAVISGKKVTMFKMATPEPVSVGTDSENIYEYVIKTNLIYER